MLIYAGMNERPRIVQLKTTSEMRTKQWVLLVVLMGFVLALSAARGHLVDSLINASAGGTAEACFEQLQAGPGAGRDLPRTGGATMAGSAAQAQVCIF